MKTQKEHIRIIPHRHSCGKPKMANGKHDVVEIACGDDLGGNNNEFYQCPECRDKDFQEYWINIGRTQAISEFKEKVRERIDKTLAEGIKRNNILPHDWAMNRIDEVLDKTAQEIK